MSKSQSGVMLIEALVAILLFSVGVVAVMGMQAVSIEQVSQAKYRTDASYLADQIIGKMWTDQPNLANYATVGYSGRTAWDAVVASTLPNGTGTITVAAPQVTVTVNWRLPNETVTRKFTSIANINSPSS
ncbi:MAG TPA: prepilin-type cleavage/methylation domain-containing protein [Usitatibacter sp.]|nr:prepilin-type cleavage/methylation domain-containing protein [Usitatibacter sp.]